MNLPIDTLIFSLFTGIFVGVAAGYLGSLMVLERMSLVGDALSHVALPGLALGYVYHFNQFVGAFAFLFVSAIIIWELRRVTLLPFETIVGAMFTLALAIGILIIPQIDLLEALFGNIASVSLLYALVAVICSIIAIVATQQIYKRLVLGMISEDLAISKGINIGRVNLVYLLLVSLIVAVGIQVTGTLLVGFLVIVPAAAAKSVSSNLKKYAILSALFGAVSAGVGILVSTFVLRTQQELTLLVGPMIVFCGIAIFIFTSIIKWNSSRRVLSRTSHP
jgi:ABC-type Mn2+/Zn2+ transport system permease subunit